MKSMKQTKKIYKPGAIAAILTLLFLGFSLTSFRASEKAADDMWKMLGISRQAGSEKIKNSFMNGYLDHYGIRNLKNIALNDRAAIAKDLLTYTKEYVSSETFRKEYDKMRSQAKPEEPQLKPLRTIEQIQKEEIEKTEKSIRETEKNMKENPDFAKTLQPLLDMLKQSLKEYQNPKHQFWTAIAQGEKYDQENQVKSYRERMKQWEEFYPSNVNDFVAERLKTMLEDTKDIDYNAQLVEKYGKKRFANPKYEGKGTEWKQGFRAGKEVTEMARGFVKKWLEELVN